MFKENWMYVYVSYAFFIICLEYTEREIHLEYTEEIQLFISFIYHVRTRLKFQITYPYVLDEEETIKSTSAKVHVLQIA